MIIYILQKIIAIFKMKFTLSVWGKCEEMQIASKIQFVAKIVIMLLASICLTHRIYSVLQERVSVERNKLSPFIIID